MRSSRTLALGLATACTIGLGVSTTLGVGYDTRHSSHEGFYRVAVHDEVTPPPDFHRPRRTVVVVYDGLGHEEAEHMQSLERLRNIGQCRRTYVGPLSVSRPVYAVLSTGMEQDRTGMRGNDDTSPLGAESIWDVARAAGLRVGAVSELPWWRELFPHGFDAYAMPPRGDDYFTRLPRADLDLVHPIYVDETGHSLGAGSPAYRRAVARADEELGHFLDEVDLSRDLVIATADHGHTLRGGHGGRQARVANVLTCYAGPGVRHVEEIGAMRTMTIAPSIALLLGLHFPSGMRAGDDDLDTLWNIADPSALPASYLAERHAAVERFRERNRVQLAAWMPESEGRWGRFRLLHRELQALRALPSLAVLALVLFALARLRRRRVPKSPAWLGPLFVVGVGAALLAVQIAAHGSFDLSSVSSREDFIAFTVAMTFGVSMAAAALHLAVDRSVKALLIDWTALSLAGSLVSLTHPLALGWHVGYPAAPAELQFFPYFAALALGVIDGLGLIGAAAWMWRSRRVSSSPTARP